MHTVLTGYMICIWFSWCHCHPIISCFSKIQNGLSFWYWLTWVVPDEGHKTVVVVDVVVIIVLIFWCWCVVDVWILLSNMFYSTSVVYLYQVLWLSLSCWWNYTDIYTYVLVVSILVVVCTYFTSRRCMKYCNEVSDSLYVCLSTHIHVYKKLHVRSSQNFLCLLPVAVALSFSETV